MNLVVGFAEASYTQTITEIISVTLLHPCKLTLITTAQTIADQQYVFGDPTLLISFSAFADSVSVEYGIAGLCALTYSLSLATDATAYGATILTTPSLQISVLTTNNLLFGTSVSLTLLANGTPQQDTASQTVTFNLTIIDPCQLSTIDTQKMTQTDYQI